jgi:hypothetical protein
MKASHEMNGTISEYNSSFGGIFECIFSFAFFSRDSCDTTSQMVSLKIFYIFYEECLEEEIIETKHGQGIIEGKTEKKGG